MKYDVYRGRNRIFFISPDFDLTVQLRLRQAKKLGMSPVTQLTYLATYVIDTKSNTMIKNRYPDKEQWPKQVFEEVFSGVSNATDI